MAIQQKGFITSTDNVSMEGGTDPKYGNVTWKSLISGHVTPTSDFILGVGYLPPSGELPLHKHTPTEFYYFLSGKGEVMIDGELFYVSEGTVVYIPGNALHGIKAYDEELSFIYGFAEDSFENVEYIF